jgi:hypothetical protein
MEEIGEIAIVQGKLDYFQTNRTLQVSPFDSKEKLLSVTQCNEIRDYKWDRGIYFPWKKWVLIWNTSY